MVRCTITKVLTQLDTLILVHLGTGSIFGVLSIWGYRTCTYSIHGPSAVNQCGGFGTHFRLLLSASVSIFSVWFWYSAVLPGSSSLNNDSGPCRILRTFMACSPLPARYTFTNFNSSAMCGLMVVSVSST